MAVRSAPAVAVLGLVLLAAPAATMLPGCSATPGDDDGGAIDAPTYIGDWTLAALGGQDVASMLVEGANAPSFTINPDGSVGGFAGVNRLSTSFNPMAAAGEPLFGPAITTRMAGPGPLMELESRFLQALADTKSASIEAGNLALRDAEGVTLATLVPAAR